MCGLHKCCITPVVFGWVLTTDLPYSLTLPKYGTAFLCYIFTL